MKKLENLTLKQITDYIIDDIATKQNISKSLAKKLFINAISYNIVVEAINEQVDFLINYEENPEATAILLRIAEHA